MEPVTLHPSRLKSISFLLLSLAFVVSGVWIIDKNNNWIGWVGTIFFGICSIIFVLNLLPGRSYLTLTAEGFEVSSLSRKQYYRWEDIEQFGVASIGMNKMVVYNFSTHYVKSKTGRVFSKNLAGWEAGLHDTFGMKPEKLMNLMNTYLEMAKKQLNRNY